MMTQDEVKNLVSYANYQSTFVVTIEPADAADAQHEDARCMGRTLAPELRDSWNPILPDGLSGHLSYQSPGWTHYCPLYASKAP